MCERCAELEERVAWLESELGLQARASELHRLRTRLLAVAKNRGLNPARGYRATSELLLILYHAKGRVVSPIQVLESIPPQDGGEDDRSINLVRVWICTARALLPPDSIATLHGRGFCLTPKGLLVIADMLMAPSPLGMAA